MYHTKTILCLALLFVGVSFSTGTSVADNSAANQKEADSKLLCRIKLKTSTKLFGLKLSHGKGDYFVKDQKHCERIAKTVLIDLNRNPKAWKFLIREHLVEVKLKHIDFSVVSLGPDRSLRAIADSEKKPFFLEGGVRVPYSKQVTKLASTEIKSFGGLKSDKKNEALMAR